MKTHYLLFIILCFPLWVIGQINHPTQTIKGTVIDKDTQQPLIGATVSLEKSDPPLGTVTDLDGNFRLENVPVGRQKILCSYIGYQAFLSDYLIVNSAKEVALYISLVESAITTDEVVVTAFQSSNEPLNELSIVSTRSFSVEETQRYAASANDPSRMTMGFPGVQPSRDSRSDIVIRGNSSIGMLWRLEGIDIPNPNHFARRGSSGGGITVFSVSMLSNSDFSTGAFPAEYGNAFSGVFDIKFRKGNREKREYSFRAGVLGLDISTEGPFKKGRGSYLINYRYSTLGLLNQMGIYLVNPRADNIFQDLSFNLYFPSKNNKSTLSIWGIGGLSDEFQRAIDDLTPESTYSERLTRDFQTDMAAVGTTHTYLIDDKSYIKTSLAAMGQKIIFRNDTLNLERTATTINDEAYTNVRYVLTSFYNRKFSSKTTMKTGFFINSINYDLFHKDWISPGEEVQWLDKEGSTFLIQPYVQFRFRPTEKLTINAGVHAMFLTLNNTNSIEPRLGLKYQLSEKNSLSLAYGLHSRMVPIGSYFTTVNGSNPNLNLELIKSHHLIAAFDQALGQGARFHMEAYYQRLFDVPVSAETGNTHSILNDIDGFAIEALVSEGKGQNVGVDISLEKAFKNQTFFLLSGSVFNSTYSDQSGEFYDTRYNSNYTATFMGGKEFSFKNNGTLQTGLKLLFHGGGRITPLLDGQFGDGQNPPWDWSQPFSEKVSPYFRPDLRIAYRKDNAKSAWTLSLDVQNVINRTNQDGLDRTYDPDTKSWTDRNQSGLTPLLSFQIDW
ncbi:MAG: hypothetical protein ACI8X3_002073 [Saprospiraceae bacterium]|jgi:hypothetical protein